MKQRCYNVRNPRYRDYGGRGIKVCDRWLNDAQAFYDDMGPRPKGMKLERKDNDGNYEPDNCVWATDESQANNRRKAKPRKHRWQLKEERERGLTE